MLVTRCLGSRDVDLLILEVVINSKLAAHSEARLVTVVVVTKVMAVAGGLEQVSKLYKMIKY